jgi:hypothetical protein
MDLGDYKRLLKENEELVDHLIDKNEETKFFYEKWLYFTNCVDDGCEYAEACIKLMRKDIDEFCSGRSANNSP